MLVKRQRGGATTIHQVTYYSYNSVSAVIGGISQRTTPTMIAACAPLAPVRRLWSCMYTETRVPLGS